MENRIKITTDSTCDLTAELIKRYKICEVLPMDVALGSKTVKDGSFEVQEIYNFVEKTKKLPKTSAINVFEFEELFKRHTADGCAVLHFSISSKLSSSFQNAQIAASKFNNVYVVDAEQLSTGTSLLILYAHDMLAKNPNMPAKKVFEILTALTDKIQASFCVNTITYLYKGGRCNALSLLGANILNIHPSLHLKGGSIVVGKKYRGKMVNIISDYINDLKINNLNYDDTRCFVTYTEGTNREVIDKAIAQIKEIFAFKEIFETTAGSTITVHCGPGTIGLLFMNK